MNDQTEREQAMRAEWQRDVIDAAAYAELIKLPWVPSPAMREALAGYYEAGLSPADAAEALFAVRQ